MIYYKCHVCGQEMESPPSKVGQSEKCPKCGEIVRIPKASVQAERQTLYRSAAPSPPKPPKYFGLNVAAGSFLAIGTLLWIIGLVTLIWITPNKEFGVLTAMVAILGGLQMDAIGFGLLCLRDIALNTFKTAEAANNQR